MLPLLAHMKGILSPGGGGVEGGVEGGVPSMRGLFVYLLPRILYPPPTYRSLASPQYRSRTEKMAGLDLHI